MLEMKLTKGRTISSDGKMNFILYLYPLSFVITNFF